MIITKTEQFNRRFLYDLAELVIFKREYIDEISKWEREGRLLDIGYGRQPSRKVKFLGSYFEKKVGSMVTDIDVNVLVEQHDLKNPKFISALEKVVAACEKSGKVAGILAFSPEAAVEYKKLGFKFIAISGDSTFLASAITSALEIAKGEK